MTDQFNSDIGRAAVEAYLDSVDEALIVAHAPRSDRLQVLQDLESQIADMLAQQPQPLTEEAVQAVIKTLEPPSHFAATYGNGKRPTPAAVKIQSRLSEIRWPLVSLLSAAALPSACLFLWFAAITVAHGPAVGLVLMCMFFTGFVFTPFALWMARRQLLAGGENSRDRNLLVQAIIVYGTMAPALLVILAAMATDGAALIPLGVVAFVYLQYVIVRRVCRHMTSGMPKVEPPTAAQNGGDVRSALVPAGP